MLNRGAFGNIDSHITETNMEQSLTVGDKSSWVICSHTHTLTSHPPARLSACVRRIVFLPFACMFIRDCSVLGQPHRLVACSQLFIHFHSFLLSIHLCRSFSLPASGHRDTHWHTSPVVTLTSDALHVFVQGNVCFYCLLCFLC